MNLIQICFGFVFNGRMHPEAFQKHLSHPKLTFWGRKCAHDSFCKIWQKYAKRRSRIVWSCICDSELSFFHQKVQKRFVWIWNRSKHLLWTSEILLHTHKIFVGPLEARKITFVVGYNQGYRRMIPSNMHANLHTPSYASNTPVALIIAHYKCDFPSF